MRAREDLEARDNRKIAKEINSGTRTGNKVYKTFFFQTKKKKKNLFKTSVRDGRYGGAHEVKWEP